MEKILIQGICYDAKSSYQRGPALAPARIREALTCGSSNGYTEQLRYVDLETLEDRGDFSMEDYFEIRAITARHLATGGRVLTLGGDHSITYPILQAYAQRFGKLDILHIDAHSDLYDSFEGDPHSHACPFARIMENGLAQNLVQVGVRTLNPHQAEQAQKYNVAVHQMKDLDLNAIPGFKNPVYLSLDMDAFDPAFAPGVSHHEPGGLTSRQVIDLIQGLDVNLVGADIVEYNPNRDVQGMTAFLAAKMMKEILGKMMG